jgi:hypothetical protein
MIPRLQDKVKLDASNEVYLVVGIDYARRKVDVVPTSSDFIVVQDLPFECLTPLWRTALIPAAA